ncbi:9633_t:CDS:2 [Cetraspora pellucida]|uniref:9633_t:CDS:1 n=1 Tax=Cetraspora pellucida TaxID=1433469 RepID=A0ACA9JXE7_9GLOM|nr:9633_t:CDS:2 [Cetraspora pellucida]
MNKILNLEHFEIDEFENSNIQDINTDQREKNSPKLNADNFINLIECKDLEIQGFFNILYNAINPKDKVFKT